MSYHSVIFILVDMPSEPFRLFGWPARGSPVMAPHQVAEVAPLYFDLHLMLGAGRSMPSSGPESLIVVHAAPLMRQGLPQNMTIEAIHFPGILYCLFSRNLSKSGGSLSTSVSDSVYNWCFLRLGAYSESRFDSPMDSRRRLVKRPLVPASTSAVYRAFHISYQLRGNGVEHDHYENSHHDLMLFQGFCIYRQGVRGFMSHWVCHRLRSASTLMVRLSSQSSPHPTEVRRSMVKIPVCRFTSYTRAKRMHTATSRRELGVASLRYLSLFIHPR